MRQAQAVENLGYHLYFDLTRRRTNAVFAPDDRAIDCQSWAGVGPRHVSWSPGAKARLFPKQAAPDERDIDEAAKRGFVGNPFVMHAPEPFAVYYEPDFSLVCEVGEHTVSSLLSAYDGLGFSERLGLHWVTSDTLAEASANWDRTIKVYHLEDEHYCYDVAQSERGGGREAFTLDALPNLAGRPRYSFAAGHLTSAREPWRAFRPLIHPLYALAEQKNILQTLLNSGALSTGRPIFQEVKIGSAADDAFSILSRSANEERVIVVGLQDGKAPQPRDGYEIRPLAVPEPRWLEVALQQTIAEEIAYGFPPSLAPDAPVEATSGTDRSRQMEAAKHFLEPPLQNLASAWHETLWLMFDQLGATGLPITFLERQFAQGKAERVPQVVRAEFFEDIDLEVRFESLNAAVVFARNEMMRRDVALGFTAPSTYMAVLHDDPVAEAERAAMDQVGIAMDKLAIQDALAIAQALRGETAMEVAAKYGFPLPQPSGDGTSMEMGGQRAARPPVPMAGVGMPPEPPEQTPEGEVAPAVAGLREEGTAR